MPHFLGAIGGRPNHALYFMGCCDDHLIYLDPHTTQEAVTLPEEPPPSSAALPGKADRSYHTERAGRMDVDQLDPSLALVSFEKGAHSCAYLLLCAS